MDFISPSLLCSGWVLKKRSSGDFFGSLRTDQYDQRYLTLSPKSLRYYHKKPSIGHEIKASGDILLHSIYSVAIYSIKNEKMEEKYEFEVDLGGKKFIFQLPEKRTAEVWVESIIRARDIFMRVVYKSERISDIDAEFVSKKTWNFDKSSIMQSLKGYVGSALSGKASGEGEAMYECLGDEDVYVVLRLEHLITSSAYLFNKLPEFVFAALAKHPRKIQVDRCKQLGVALALWANKKGTSNDLNNTEQSYIDSILSDSDDLVDSKLILSTWLSFIVKKELDNCGKNLSANKSDASAVMPFRVDSPESLLASNMMRVSFQSTGLLSEWLNEALFNVSTDPFKYMFTKTMSMPSFNPDGTVSPPASPPVSMESDEDINMRIVHTCAQIIEKMIGSQSQLSFNVFELLVRSIKCGTMGEAYQWNLDADNDNDGNEVEAPLEVTEQDSPVKQSEEGFGFHLNNKLFRMSLSTLIFLRCVCPAILSPIEWGAMLRWSNGSLSAVNLASNSNDNMVDISKLNALFDGSSSSNDDGSSVSSSSDHYSRKITFDIDRGIVSGKLASRFTSSTTDSNPESSPKSSKASDSGRDGLRDRDNNNVFQLRQTRLSYSIHHNTLARTEKEQSDNNAWYMSIPDDKLGFPTVFVALISHILIEYIDEIISNQFPDSSGSSSSSLSSLIVPRDQIELIIEMKTLMRMFTDKFSIDRVIVWMESVCREMTSLPSTVSRELVESGCDIDSLNSKKALMEVAKIMQKIANIACMQNKDRQKFLQDELKRRNVACDISEDNLSTNLLDASLLLQKFYEAVGNRCV